MPSQRAERRPSGQDAGGPLLAAVIPALSIKDTVGLVWNPRADSKSSEVGPQFGTSRWDFKAESAVLAVGADLAPC